MSGGGCPWGGGRRQAGGPATVGAAGRGCTFEFEDEEDNVDYEDEDEEHQKARKLLSHTATAKLPRGHPRPLVAIFVPPTDSDDHAFFMEQTILDLSS